jgi:hypothetical protein
MNAIVTHEQLKTATGYDRPSDIEKCLRKSGVRYLHGKTGIFTTVDALNAAMGLSNQAPPPNTGGDIDIL